MSFSPDAVSPASFTDALSRMQQLEAMVDQISSPSLLGAAAAAPATAAGSASSFQQALAAAGGASGVAPSGDTSGNAGLAALQVAESQVGVTEQPPGSND